MRNLKKVVALVAVFAMLVSSVAFGQTFSDVADDANYYEAIEMLNGLNILTGDDQDGDGVMDFRPEDTITRAEVAAVISRIQGINSAAQTDTVFTDVTASHWASGYVAQAAGQGIVNGYGDGTFGPENPVLYEQAVKMIVETLGYAPFVAENGGYYAGHMTAASRYGVLEGVVGGTIGKEATRGQVAQMLYNAVDTPLMERASYGDEASYVIYNGFSSSAANYVTLLKRDLKVKKFEGTIVANPLTTYTAAATVDTDKEAQVSIVLNGDEVNAYYDTASVSTWLVGDTNAADYIGMEVTGYAKQTGISGRYEIIAVSPTSLNDVTSFTLDNFKAVGTNEVEYYTDKDNGIYTTVKAEATLDAIIYNGVAFDASPALADVFGSTKVVDVNSKYSGEVIFIDNDATAGADVVIVNVAVPGVVDEVNNKGKILFKTSMVNPAGGSIGRIVLDDEDTAQIINITKNGEAIDYSELKEWDVVSAIWSPSLNKVVSLEVLDSTVVEGKVAQSKTSLTSNGGKAYVIDGVEYDIAANAYQPSPIKLGSAGLFYVDAYGKIVAYNKNGTANVSDNYGYILAASAVTDDWQKENVKVQLLAKDGNVYEAFLADEVEIANYAALLTETEGTGSDAGTYKVTEFNNNTVYYEAGTDVFEVADFTATTGATAFAAALQNTLITYEANAAGEIDTIGVATTVADDAEDNGWLFEAVNYTAGSNAYDEEDKELTINGTTVNITEDTLVFYINPVTVPASPAVFGYNYATVASKLSSKVAASNTIGDVVSGTPVAIFDVDDNDDAGVVVIFNTIGGISASTNIAVLAGPAGQAVVDGDKVTAVEFFMGGEKKQAYVDKNATGDKSALASASFGDVFKFAFNADGTAITAVKQCFDFTDRAYVETVSPSPIYTTAVMSNVAAFAAGTNVGEVAAKGFAIKYNSSNKRITLAAASDLTTEVDTVKAANANVYVYEPSKIANKVYVGDASDINVEEDIIKKTGSQKITNSDGDIVGTSDSVVGLLDYVVSFEYDGDVIDVVIYKPADFGVYNVQ